MNSSVTAFVQPPDTGKVMLLHESLINEPHLFDIYETDGDTILDIVKEFLLNSIKEYLFLHGQVHDRGYVARDFETYLNMFVVFEAEKLGCPSISRCEREAGQYGWLYPGHGFPNKAKRLASIASLKHIKTIRILRENTLIYPLLTSVPTFQRLSTEKNKSHTPFCRSHLCYLPHPPMT